MLLLRRLLEHGDLFVLLATLPVSDLRLGCHGPELDQMRQAGLITLHRLLHVLGPQPDIAHVELAWSRVHLSHFLHHLEVVGHSAFQHQPIDLGLALSAERPFRLLM